ncbi:uncharacterized protein IL334_002713 [Kwoniella shivajii]|uniref:Uncharacterized protein n=1 Tax=Kwoniella shivajii TaxID=564305 RepID=A0ABZ1CX68_9TREE|nr:hypothetical protein IL334_002713 [Kwoniella shivajii]
MAPTASSSAPHKGVERKRKAGGNGKKGKVFVEDKKDLLSLMSSITSSKDKVAESKVAKRKAVVDETAPVNSDDKNKKSKKGLQKEKALEEAKASVLEKQRLKKKRKSTSNKPASTPDKPVKKRVGFA